jgi:ferritin-like metal-binding protein YciE
MAELSARDTKLVQYLNEAYSKEKGLETALQAHIGMTSRGNYKKRLQQHLADTRAHTRELERRIKKVGGAARATRVEAPEPIAKGASAALELGSRAVAAVKWPLNVLRGTGEQEKMLKNAKTEYADAHGEIATYTAIEALADVLSDVETAKLARSIRREEERMAQFLERLIPQLTKAVTQHEIPAAERRSASSRRRSHAARKRSQAARSNGASARGPAASARGNSSASRSRAAARAGSASTRAGSASSARKPRAGTSSRSAGRRSAAASKRTSATASA